MLSMQKQFTLGKANILTGRSEPVDSMLITITSTQTPILRDIVGGVVDITDNLDGTFTASSSDAVSSFSFSSGEPITKVVFHGMPNAGDVLLNTLFSGLHDLLDVDLYGLRGTSGYTNIGYMFASCASIKTIDISMLNTTGATSADNMFDGCSELETVNISGVNFGSCVSMQKLFQNCYKLINIIGLEYIDVSSNTNTTSMFNGCYVIEELDFTQWDISKLESSVNMFRNCHKLNKINFDGTNVESLIDTGIMFYYCHELSELGIKWRNFKPRKINHMFYSCSSLERIDNIKEWDMSDNITLSNTFRGCLKLQDYDFSTWDLSVCNDTSYAFRNMNSIKTLLLPTFTPTGSMVGMFHACSKLECISNLDSTQSTDKSSMFLSSTKLVSPSITEQDDITDVDGLDWVSTTPCE